MIENVTNPINQLLYKKKANTVMVDLSKLSGKVFYKNGKTVDLPTENGCLKLKMNCGDAIFIEEKEF